MSPQKCPIILLDGGLGTLLTSPPHLQTFNHSTPLWSSHLLLSSPSTLLSAQSSFATSGADVLLTATYQVSFEGFANTAPGYAAKDAERYMRSAVGIARQALSEGRGKGMGKLALSLGAYGATMVPSSEYSGVYDSSHSSITQLRDWHFKRLEVFLPLKEEEEERRECWRNVDLLAFETVPRIDEVFAVREAVFMSMGRAEERPFWISCVFPGEENRLPDGSSLREVVRAMLGRREGASRPMGVGLNCTKVGKVDGLVREFEDALKDLGEDGRGVSLVIYPDGTRVGERYNTVTQRWEVDEEARKGGQEKEWDEEVFGIVIRARERGVWESIYVGGCCRVGPEEIGKLRKRVDKVIN
ncbi:Homocysteine S-methyltransferase [Mollisia scopiformis]|uniref:Homocysteine S-methyltransferase n=1 Tax=Mollisia scopiformis TaxID=149040 RepID=A0A194XRM4_MOLSC|nr:Homocysteine S-methyltransferase [Mollisia scopiformis]KUJ22801.1 Homocysteine S-methyltransferase [Mollisia scopiformis]